MGAEIISFGKGRAPKAPTEHVHLLLTLAGGRLPSSDRKRTVSDKAIRIGRHSDNDWVLPDSERIVSNRHCLISPENGRFVLTDVSSNGIYMNNSAQATARDSRTVLSDGDQLRIGNYVIAVQEVDDSPSLIPHRDDLSADFPASRARDPLDVDPLDDPLGRPHPSFQHPITPRQTRSPSVDPFDAKPARSMQRIEPDEDLFRGIAPDKRWQGAPRSDHAPAPSQAVPPLRVAPAVPAGEIDFDALLGDLIPSGTAAARDTPPPPDPQPDKQPRQSAKPMAPGPPDVKPASNALAAFLDGAGVGGLPLDDRDPEAALRAAGAVFRVMADGIREILASRAAIKGEMRVTQTMIRARGNNALKFAVTADDAVVALLTPDRRGYLNPLAAAREAFADVKSHELAVVAGMQAALLALLRRFDPSALEERLTAGPLDAVLPHARKARYWDAFRQTYGQISREAEDDFQSVFGRSFAETYRRLATNDRNRTE